jgi:hypothetical protein
MPQRRRFIGIEQPRNNNEAIALKISNGITGD